MKVEIDKMIKILSVFLGEPKNIDNGNSFQYQFNCPSCIEKYGESERSKHNLEINVCKNVYQCWKCSSSGNDDMHGKISKLFRLYGNEQLWSEYKECLDNIRSSELYKLNYTKDDFKANDNEDIKEYLEFPNTYHIFKEDKSEECIRGLNYLLDRGIGWDIIKKYKIGYTTWDSKNPLVSNRIIIPSFNEYNELNYWVGRDFTLKSKLKYWNAKAEKKDIIFNECMINWDSDITLCEGPFDYLGINLNCIPLLGKALSSDFLIYKKLFEKANANINIWLDGDAIETVYHLYKILNQGRLYNKIRYIPIQKEYDPSDIYRMYGKKGIIEYLKNSVKINEIYL